MPLYRRVPKRGFTNARFRTEYTIINVRELEAFDNGATVDLDAILAFYREHIQGRPQLISITGDKSKMDLEALAAEGEIIELTLEDLFAF